MFVDDDTTMHDAYVELLRFGGLCSIATGSARAPNFAARFAPGIIVIHLWASDRRGFDVVRTLKADGQTRDIPIVAFASPDAEPAAMQAGCDVFLRRPIRAPGLLATLRDMAQSLGHAAPGPRRQSSQGDAAVLASGPESPAQSARRRSAHPARRTVDVRPRLTLSRVGRWSAFSAVGRFLVGTARRRL